MNYGLEESGAQSVIKQADKTSFLPADPTVSIGSARLARGGYAGGSDLLANDAILLYPSGESCSKLSELNAMIE
jgi:hypothetical protein